MKLNGNTVSINQLKIEGHVDNLAVVVQMLRQILNAHASFGIITRSDAMANFYGLCPLRDNIA